VTFKIILTVIIAISVGQILEQTGKERKPISGGACVVSAVLNGVLIYGIWSWI